MSKELNLRKDSFVRNILTIAFFLQLSLTMAQQQVETTYFANRSLTMKVTERKAVYKKIVFTTDSGTSHIEVVQLKNNQVVSRESYLGKEPIGKWISADAIGRQRELDYNFPLAYTESLCKADSASYIDFKKVRVYPFTDSDSLSYVAPKFATGEKNMSAFVSRRIIYPQQALQREIWGVVQIQLVIGHSGQVEAIAIKKGINVLLDKEAMRIARELKFLNGASIKGVNKKVCAIVPISFIIADLSK